MVSLMDVFQGSIPAVHLLSAVAATALSLVALRFFNRKEVFFPRASTLIFGSTEWNGQASSAAKRAVLAKTRPSVLKRAALAKKTRNLATVIWPDLADFEPCCTPTPP
jgi:hypothetical protein